MTFDEAVAQVKEHDGHTISLQTLKDHNPKCWDAIKFLEGWNEAIYAASIRGRLAQLENKVG